MAFDYSLGGPKRIAIVGGGISGLAAAWELRSHHKVTLFESEARFGGHARTIEAGRLGTQAVDTGFIVFNYVNYPHLTGLFRDLDVPVMRSDMSFGVSLNEGRLEYALRSADALFGQRRNLLRPEFWQMLRDIFRFNAAAFETAAGQKDLTIEGLLDQLRLSAAFRRDYLYPLCGAIWSTPREEIGLFPAETLLRFLRNHGLMQARGSHAWWTVQGGSREYVTRLLAALRSSQVQLRADTPVRTVRRTPNGVTIVTNRAEPETFDEVIFACPADIALAALGDPRPEERKALSDIRFQKNRVVLHCDPSVMPKQKRCWSSWVYRDAGPNAADVGVTYWMNRLQSIPMDDPLFVSLNPAASLREESIYNEHLFRHPVFDHAALRAQTQIAALQGENHTWFTGAWLRNGFHEDGFASAVRVTRRLLAAAPARLAPL